MGRDFVEGTILAYAREFEKITKDPSDTWCLHRESKRSPASHGARAWNVSSAC